MGSSPALRTVQTQSCVSSPQRAGSLWPRTRACHCRARRRRPAPRFAIPRAVSPAPTAARSVHRRRRGTSEAAPRNRSRRGTSTCKVTSRGCRIHRIRAAYSGDAHFGGSDSASAQMTVSTRPSLHVAKQSLIVTLTVPQAVRRMPAHIERCGHPSGGQEGHQPQTAFNEAQGRQDRAIHIRAERRHAGGAALRPAPTSQRPSWRDGAHRRARRQREQRDADVQLHLERRPGSVAARGRGDAARSTNPSCGTRSRAHGHDSGPRRTRSGRAPARPVVDAASVYGVFTCAPWRAM